MPLRKILHVRGKSVHQNFDVLKTFIRLCDVFGVKRLMNIQQITKLCTSGHSLKYVSRELNLEYGNLYDFVKRHSIPHGDTTVSLTNERFDRLVCVKPTNRRLHRSVVWECRCDCGNLTYVSTRDLKSKNTKSCGCLRVDATRKRSLGKTGADSFSGWAGYQEIHGNFFSSIRRNAEIRNLTFDLTLEQLWSLFLTQDRRCALTGEPLVFQTQARIRNGTASLDRINSAKGYTLDNVQWVHKTINKMKNNLSEEAFLTWACKIADHSKQTPI